MRTPWTPLSLLAMSLVLGCTDDGATDSTTSLTTTQTTGLDTGTDGPDTGDGDPGDGDGDPGDGDGDSGDGDGYCVHQCMSDDDCLVDGMNADLTCIENVCTSDGPSGCTSDEECVALYSGWVSPCTAGGGECDGLGQVCLDIGLCATPPSDFIDCATLLMEEIQTTDIDGNPVTVCSRTDAVCNDDNFCFVPCESDGDCPSEAYPICNVSTGLCGCGSDADCATLGTPHFSVCNAGVCGCNADQQCIDSMVGDVCTVDGSCGCSSDSACAGLDNPYDGGAFVCGQP
jgi:hypothetical protein